MNSKSQEAFIWQALDRQASTAMDGADLWPRIKESVLARQKTARRLSFLPTTRLGWTVFAILLFAILGGAAAATPVLIERLTHLDESAEILPPDGPTLEQHLEWELEQGPYSDPSHPAWEFLPDRSTIEIVTAGRTENTILILATAKAHNGTPLYMYKELHPLDHPVCKARGPLEECPDDLSFTWFPSSGGSGPLVEGVPVFINAGGIRFEPRTTRIIGYFNADPNLPLSYMSNSGKRKTIDIEEPVGILLFEDMEQAPEVSQP